MKKILFVSILTILLCSLPVKLSTDDFNEFVDNPFPLSEIDQQWVNKTFANMSLKDKCAQMIISAAGTRDTNFESNSFKRLEKLVSKFKVGGLIFFQSNSHDLVLVSNKLQSLSEVPLLLSADFERGPGMRLEDIEQFPHNMALGATNDPTLSYLMGKYTAITSRALGVHYNFAPLLDVNNDYRNPVINIRAYSEDPNIISWYGNSFILGMHDGGMLTTAKHFPGHGATDLDSHLELPIIRLSKEEFENQDLLPFREAINVGVKSIMVGHLQVPAFDKREGMPATLSEFVIQDYLKDKLGFKGLIVTDAMNMQAIKDSFDCDIAAEMAVAAGNDFILFPEDDSLAIEGIYNAVISGSISESRIDESVLKILSAKKWLNLDVFNQIDYQLASAYINMPDQKRLALEIGERAITLVKDDNNLVPINPEDYYQTACITLRSTNDRNNNDKKLFEELVEKNFGYTKLHQLNLKSRKQEYENALATAKKSDLILLNLFISSNIGEENEYINESHLKLIQDLQALNKKILICNFGNPYLLTEFKDAPSYLCSYSWTNSSQTAMFNSITGRNEISGRLPVSIPGTDLTIGFGHKQKLNKLFIQDSVADSNYNFSKIESLVKRAIEDSVFPGAVVLIGHRKRVIYNKPFGRFTYDSTSTEMSTESIFDLASVTKVAGTTSAAMILYDKGMIKLDQKVSSILPEFKNHGKENITIQHLLVHNSGLPAFKRYYTKFNSRKEVINDIMNTDLIFKPGTDYTYSDLGMITMQLIIEKLTGQPIDQFLKSNIFDVLGMANTLYNPPPEKWYYCVPTEVDNYWRYTTCKGKVHDENAFLMGGVAGHAGLFSTTTDLAKLMFLYVNDGYFNGETIFKPETIDLFTSIRTKYGDRGFGWGIKSVDGYSSAGSKFSNTSFGHTGFTGTSIWVDKERGVFVILLTNRVYPTRENTKISSFRPKLHDAVIEAISYR